MGKEFVIATDHKALKSELGENRSNKSYQSRLTRWVDIFLPYQFKVTHIPGKDMGIVDYLSREPNGDPWPEFKIDERFVVTSIEDFHKALDCLNSRLNNVDGKVNVNILDHSGVRNNISHCKDDSSHGCYSNQFVQNQTKLDQNENGQNSRPQKEQNEQNTLNKISRTKQSVINSGIKSCKNKTKNQSEKAVKIDKNQSGPRKSKKAVKIINRRQYEEREEMTEQVTEKTFSRTRMVTREACSRQDSDSSDSDIAQVEWRAMYRYIKHNKETGTSSGRPLVAMTKLISFWDLMGAERKDNPRSGLELKAQTEMQSRAQQDQEVDNSSKGYRSPIVEVDLTAESPEVSVIRGRRANHNSRRDEFRQAERNKGESLDNLTKLFDRSLLAELITEDPSMDRLRRVIERNVRNSFELMGPHTNRHQVSVVDDCILVDNRLAVSGQLRQAALKRIHRGHPGQEAMLDVSRYLWWPHMHKDIVNLAEECRSYSRYVKNAKYNIPKNDSKPLPLLTQPSQEVQLDYTGPLEDHKRKTARYSYW